LAFSTTVLIYQWGLLPSLCSGLIISKLSIPGFLFDLLPVFCGNIGFKEKNPLQSILLGDLVRYNSQLTADYNGQFAPFFHDFASKISANTNFKKERQTAITSCSSLLFLCPL
jgi:hypothetical protein